MKYIRSKPKRHLVKFYVHYIGEWNLGFSFFHYCSENWQKSNPFFSLNQFTIEYDIDNSLKVETRPNNISCMDGLYSKRNGCGIIENEWDIHFVRVVWQMMFEICGSKFGKVCPIREEEKVSYRSSYRRAGHLATHHHGSFLRDSESPSVHTTLLVYE